MKRKLSKKTVSIQKRTSTSMFARWCKLNKITRPSSSLRKASAYAKYRTLYYKFLAAKRNDKSLSKKLKAVEI